MSITDELREYAEENECKSYCKLLTAIADRIDAEHEEAIQQALMGEGGVPATDENMAENGWVRLPKDADGECIRIGDELDYLEALHQDVPARFEVQDMFYFGKDEWRLRAYPATYDPRKCRHHHAPTVEDVLTEMLAKAIERGELTNGAAQTIAEYAKRLKLAEGEDA